MVTFRDSAGHVQGPGGNVWDPSLCRVLAPGRFELLAPKPGLRDLAPRCSEAIWDLASGYGVYEGTIRIEGVQTGLVGAFFFWGREILADGTKLTFEECGAEFNYDGVPIQFVRFDEYKGEQPPSPVAERYHVDRLDSRTFSFRIDWRPEAFTIEVWETWNASRSVRFKKTFKGFANRGQRFRFQLWRRRGIAAKKDARMVGSFRFIPHDVGTIAPSADVG